MSVAYDRRITLLALAVGAPGVVTSLALLWVTDSSPTIRVLLGAAVFGLSLGLALFLRSRIVRPLQTVSNVLAALREDDFSIRAREASADDALAPENNASIEPLIVSLDPGVARTSVGFTGVGVPRDASGDTGVERTGVARAGAGPARPRVPG